MEAATVILMVVEVVIVAAGVFCRYLLSRPIAGSDEIATLVLVWLTFLGGAAAQRRRAHPRVGLFVQHLSPSAMTYIDAPSGWSRSSSSPAFVGTVWNSSDCGSASLRRAPASI
jgi:hypothetical protein